MLETLNIHAVHG